MRERIKEREMSQKNPLFILVIQERVKLEIIWYKKWNSGYKLQRILTTEKGEDPEETGSTKSPPMKLDHKRQKAQRTRMPTKETQDDTRK